MPNGTLIGNLWQRNHGIWLRRAAKQGGGDYMAAHIPTPEELFRMSGSDLKELAGGRGRAATAAQTEIERRQAKKAAKQAA